MPPTTRALRQRGIIVGAPIHNRISHNAGMPCMPVLHGIRPNAHAFRHQDEGATGLTLPDNTVSHPRAVDARQRQP
ncbi:hypothetical protein SXCC_02049 [Gluconacetobacter sp. SXCC-1]|nr:hypothetical protein SXCC_02049 [Gluconacetobacter sp. SXCC-1]SAY48177.1 hypothetical protein KRIGEM_01123 [Komagataeibacter rhaeticus]